MTTAGGGTVDKAMIDEENFTERGWDSRKVFVSRIPSHFDDGSVKRLLEERLGDGSVAQVALVYEKEHSELGGADVTETEQNNTERSLEKVSKKEAPEMKHRGFAFVALVSPDKRQEAIDLGTVRGGAKATSTKRHTLYIRPVVRQDDKVNGEETMKIEKQQNLCFLWAAFRCPYGDKCQFLHEGEGGCSIPKHKESKKQKCFAFKKGKCKEGNSCKFSHEFGVAEPSKERVIDVPKSEKDCINWKTKGKCRKGDRCPYKHDGTVREAALMKLDRKKRKRNDDEKRKNRQHLSIRVFGLNYDTTEQDVRSYFEHCGPIVEITFPTFEDSGRSKGFCGVLFQSPKAVAKAVELDGQELHGRWLRVQAGKMYLRKWKEHQSAAQSKKNIESTAETSLVGEFGQKVKKRKHHGFKE